MAQCWKEISAGIDHSVSIHQDGSLWAWGFNGNGQLGDGTLINRDIPIQIGTSTNWVELSARGNHVLAIQADGSLWAWGNNFLGQLGDGTYGNQKNAPIRIGNATNWKSVFAGREFSLALKTDGTLWSWGDNFYGQLGHSQNQFVPSQIGTSNDWWSISAGGNHVLAIKTDGTLWAWGLNIHGELGDGTEINKSTPVKVGVDTNWSSISAGDDFSIALKTDGTLWTWGNNEKGQLGDGTFVDKTVPGKRGNATTWATISGGLDHALAIRNDGTLWTWGWIIGKFGFNTDNTRNIPTKMGINSDWHLVKTGDRHAFATKTDGTIWGWGGGTWGKLGNESWVDLSDPELLTAQAPTGAAIQNICISGTVSNLLPSDGNIKWYDSPAGGSPLSSSTALVNGKQYYASQTKSGCESIARLAVTVSVNTVLPPAPVGPISQTFCGLTTVAALTAAGADIRWYSEVSGGLPLAATTALVDGVHYFASQTVNGCESTARLNVLASVNMVAPPTGVSSQTFCEGASVSALAATGTALKWYLSSAGGVPLSPSTLLVSGVHYYASQTIGSFESCDRLNVLAVVNTTLPPSGQQSQFFCNSGTVADLKATGSLIKWYSSEVGGTALSTSTALINGVDYFGTQTSNSCESVLRLQVQVSMNSAQTPLPTGSSIQNICAGSRLTALEISGQDIRWYAEPSGGSPLAGSTLVNDGTKYYATQTINACESSTRLEVLVATYQNNTQAPLIANPERWNKVSAYAYASYSIKEGGTLWSWGFAGYEKIPSPKQIGTSSDWKYITTRGFRGVGIKNDGTLWEIAPFKTVTQIGTDTDWRTVSVGGFHFVGIKTNGTLWSWGENTFGALGIGSLDIYAQWTPTQIGTDTNWKEVSAASYHNIARKADGSVWGWGDNRIFKDYEVGIEPIASPVRVSDSNDWKTVDAGEDIILGLRNDGTMWNWGWRQPGVGPTNNYNPKQVNSDIDWLKIASGQFHSMAIKTDGSLWGWGRNTEYQLGDGTNVDRNLPVPIGTDKDWQDVSGGLFHTLAIKTDGTLWAWGYNAYNEIGDGTNDLFVAVPKFIPSNSQLHCEGATVTSLSVSGENIKWYCAASSANPLAETEPLVTGGHYFVTQNVMGCESLARLDVLVSIQKAPVGPSVQNFCGGATIQDLLPQGHNIKWYSEASGGLALPLNTPLSNATQYFASQTSSSCESESRLAVSVFVNTIPTTNPIGSTIQSLCLDAKLSDIQIQGNNIKWYSSATGGYPLGISTNAVSGGHYFASQTINFCESERIEIVVEIVPPPSGEPGQFFCAGSTVDDIVATGTNLKWYDFAGNLLPAGTELQNGDTYLVTQTIGGIESCSKLDVVAYFKEDQKPTGLTTQVFCQSGLVNDLQVNQDNIAWFTEPTGGTEIPVNTPLVHDGKYYAANRENFCQVLRLEIIAQITTTFPPAPSGAIEQLFCQGETIQSLHVVGNNIEWFASAISTEALPLSTVVQQGSHYFAQQSVGGCTSQSRLEVTTSQRNPKAPTSDPIQSFCYGARVSDLQISGTDIRWYFFNNVVSPSKILNHGDVYWASQTVQGCESIDRVRVEVIVNDNHTPPPISANTKTWRSVSTGPRHYLAIRSDGTLWTWGQNVGGSLGSGQPSIFREGIPIQITMNNDWKMVFAGLDCSYAIKNDGTLWGWGLNYKGQLGDGTTTTSVVTPKQIGLDSDWKSVVAPHFMVGYGFAAAIKNNGTLWTWGENQKGQLGDGTFTNKLVPTQVGKDNNWSSVTVGGDFIVALKSNGTLWAWGGNGSMQIGDGTNITRNTPVRIGASQNWKSIFAYSNGTFAIQKDGSLWVWGDNVMNRVIHSTPFKVEMGSEWNTVSPSDDDGHVLGIKKDGTLWAWGSNEVGQLGIGTFEIRKLEPVQVGAELWELVGTGREHSVAIKKDGTLWAWGSNENALINVGSTHTFSNAPVLLEKAPNGVSIQTFCKNSTVADLVAIGSKIQWYATATGGIPLSPSTQLINGTHYYASQLENLCESNSRLDVLATVNTLVTPPPTAVQEQTVCTGSTVSHLSASGLELKWYSSLTGGVSYQVNAPLETGVHYFASQTKNYCESHTRTEVIATLSSPLPPTGDQSQIFCAGETVSKLMAAGVSVQWHETATDPSALQLSTLLVNNATYYASQTVANCESSARLAVNVALNPIPQMPIGASPQIFEEDKSVDDLIVNGFNIKWYQNPGEALLHVNQLPNETVLKNDSTYYATQTIDGCESLTSLAVEVILVTGIEGSGSVSLFGFPNPTSKQFKLSSEFTLEEVQVVNLIGQTVLSLKANSNDVTLDLSMLPQSAYYIFVKMGTKRAVLKVIKN